ncbi:hypothetical protein F2P81_005990 [Scophthalmus maximus]|uniref:Uncharacterized protein n=1 Tax=Scophthalmus maximus TaxID=52904 RepID=A0A6A4TDI5_SCOMX|nr:hypothetical protein F2P81_005990 [Scophthalmus maximus]
MNASTGKRQGCWIPPASQPSRDKDNKLKKNNHNNNNHNINKSDHIIIMIIALEQLQLINDRQGQSDKGVFFSGSRFCLSRTLNNQELTAVEFAFSFSPYKDATWFSSTDCRCHSMIVRIHNQSEAVLGPEGSTPTVTAWTLDSDLLPGELFISCCWPHWCCPPIQRENAYVNVFRRKVRTHSVYDQSCCGEDVPHWHRGGRFQQDADT